MGFTLTFVIFQRTSLNELPYIIDALGQTGISENYLGE